MSKYKRYAIVVILVSNGILISFLESFIPIPIPVPGVKLGLGNIITMIGIAFLGVRDVLFIVAIRCFVVAVLTRGVMMLAFSLTGGILSALVMALLYKKFSSMFSVKGISIAGALVHSTAQVIVASFILGQFVIMYYLPVLLVSAVITGFITGSIGEIAINEIRRKDIFGNSPQEHTDIDFGNILHSDKSDTLIKKHQILPKMDSGVKLFFAFILSIIPFLCENQISFIIISAYLIFITIFSGMKVRTVLTSFTAYFIIVVFPFLFGFLISLLFYQISGNAMFTYYQQISDTAIRMFQLFLLWYIGCIYFNTTPMKSFIGLFDKILTPFKRFGVPVEDHLKVIMCVIKVLTQIGPEVKRSFTESMSSMSDNKKWWSRINIKGISGIIVNFIVNSFKRMDAIEKYVKEVNAADLYNYRLKVSRLDIVASVSFVIVVFLVIIIENGYLM